MARKFDLSNAPGHLLRRCNQYAFDLFTKEVGNSDLTPPQFRVLLTVEQNEGLSQTDLVRRTGIDRSTLADMISRLLKRGLLSRKRTAEDARANSVSITASGRSALNSVRDKVAAAESKILDPLPASAKAAFLKALSTIAEAADKAEEAAAASTRRGPGRRKKSAAKKKTAKRKTAKRKTAKRKTAKRKTAKRKTAKRKTAAKKKTAAKRKTTAKRKTAGKRKTAAKKRTVAKKKTTGKRKTAAKKRTVAKKKTTAKKTAKRKTAKRKTAKRAKKK